jgi:hypothetical protein
VYSSVGHLQVVCFDEDLIARLRNAVQLPNLPQNESRFFEPMLCLAVPKLPERPDWQSELKLYGYRGIGIKSNRRAHLARATERISANDPEMIPSREMVEPLTIMRFNLNHGLPIVGLPLIRFCELAATCGLPPLNLRFQFQNRAYNFTLARTSIDGPVR